MSATIIHFPSRPADWGRLAVACRPMATAMPLPRPDEELDLLLELGGQLLDNLNDADLDQWLNRVTAWESGRG